MELTEEQKAALVRREEGPLTRRQRNRAQILLRTDSGETDQEIADDLGVSVGTVANVRRRLLGHVPPRLEKSDLKPWQQKSWCLPKGVDGEFVYHVEDVLELYAEPHDPARPVVCFDEASKELRGDVAEPIPPAPGSPAKQDYEYTRHGTANLFVIVEPLAGRRHITVTDRWTIPDFAGQMKYLCDVMYPEATRIRVVLDNLNTHAYGSLFATYPPHEAWRLAHRLEFHFTPKHASWLIMAECELSVLSRQCLDRRLSSQEAVAAEVGPWQEARNRAGVRLVWSFRAADARRKLAHLYRQDPQR